MPKPLFVGVEGLPGAGKSTLITSLERRLVEQDYKVATFNIDSIAEAHALQRHALEETNRAARFALFWAARYLQFRTAQAAVAQGVSDVVIVDRLLWSNVIIDYAHGIPKQVLTWFAQHIPREPDVTLFLDASLGAVLQRQRAMVLANDTVARAAEQRYRELAQRLHWVPVNANVGEHCVLEQCLAEVLRYLPQPVA